MAGGNYLKLYLVKQLVSFTWDSEIKKKKHGWFWGLSEKSES